MPVQHSNNHSNELRGPIFLSSSPHMNKQQTNRAHGRHIQINRTPTVTLVTSICRSIEIIFHSKTIVEINIVSMIYQYVYLYFFTIVHLGTLICKNVIFIWPTCMLSNATNWMKSLKVSRSELAKDKWVLLRWQTTAISNRFLQREITESGKIYAIKLPDQ